MNVLQCDFAVTRIIERIHSLFEKKGIFFLTKACLKTNYAQIRILLIEFILVCD